MELDIQISLSLWAELLFKEGQFLTGFGLTDAEVRTLSPHLSVDYLKNNPELLSSMKLEGNFHFNL